MQYFVVAKPSAEKNGKKGSKSATSSFILRDECINVGVFGQGESVVASPLSLTATISPCPLFLQTCCQWHNSLDYT